MENDEDLYTKNENAVIFKKDIYIQLFLKLMLKYES